MQLKRCGTAGGGGGSHLNKNVSYPLRPEDPGGHYRPAPHTLQVGQLALPAAAAAPELNGGPGPPPGSLHASSLGSRSQEFDAALAMTSSMCSGSSSTSYCDMVGERICGYYSTVELSAHQQRQGDSDSRPTRTRGVTLAWLSVPAYLPAWHTVVQIHKRL